MKFELVSVSDYGPKSKVVYTFETDSLSNVLEEFEQFLRGSGFYFDGHLDFVIDDFDIKIDDSQYDNVEEEFLDLNEVGNPDNYKAYFDNMNNQSGVLCPVCKIQNSEMTGFKCWDVNCPQKENAN